MATRLCIEVDDASAANLRVMALEMGFKTVEACVAYVLEQDAKFYQHATCEETLRAEEARLALDLAVDEWNVAAKKFCIRHFFKEPRYTVDVSRYRAMVASAVDIDQSVKDGLAKYLDETKLLQRVYLQVRNHFTIATLLGYTCGSTYEEPPEQLPPPPTLDDLDARFRVELADICRRADLTVAKRLQSARSRSDGSRNSFHATDSEIQRRQT